MPRFAYEARTAAGEAVRGLEIAGDEFELDRRLSDLELLLVRARVVRSGRSSGASGRALVDFCYHLAVVIEAGIPILKGLRDLVDDGHPMDEVIDEIARRIEKGSPLSAALDEYPSYFPALVRSLIRAGEESGNLDRVLHDLVRYLEWREDLGRQIRSAITYPAIVIVAMGLLVTLLTTWVLPTFMDIFVELDVDLPMTTRVLIAVQGFVMAYWPWILGGALATLVGFVVAWRREASRSVLDAWLLKLPLIGELILMLEMSRFSHNLGLLHATGVPVLRSLSLSEEIAQSRPVRASLAEGRERVEQGESLSDALGRSALMPQLVLRMVAVGESAGRLEESLERVSAHYDREVPEKISRSIAFFNTAALAFLGGLLVTIALSVFVPLYQMLGNLNAGS